MRNIIIATLFLLLLLSACDKEPVLVENDQAKGPEGLEISKSAYNFDINARDLYFINESTGFVAGYNGNIYKTADSGKSWIRLNSGTTLHLLSVFFLNENVGFASGQAMSGCLDADCGKGSVLLKTINGGETWTRTFFPAYTRILSLKFFDPLNGIAIIHTPDLPNSRDEHIAITSDGGANWKFTDLAIKPYSNKLFIVDNIVFIAGEDREIFRSADNGSSWKTIDIPVEAGNSIRSFYFYDENTGFIDGESSDYKTTDGGLTWQKLIFPFTSFRTIHFFNENEGFNIEGITAYQGLDFPTWLGSICYETKDGGESWTKSDIDRTLMLGLTFFPQNDLGYGINSTEFCTIKRK